MRPLHQPLPTTSLAWPGSSTCCIFASIAACLGASQTHTMWPTLMLSALWLAALGRGQELDAKVKSIGLRTHTLNQPYLDSDMQSRWYDFGGDAVIRTDAYIRLTSDRPSQAGWLWSKVPLTATNWEIEVEFKIHGKNNLYGDGFAVWITKDRVKMGEVFGSADKFEGLGIFFDTYKNNRPGVVFPMVMAMVGDGKTSYEKDTDGKENEFASCSARGIRHASVPTKFRLTYYQDKYIKLELQYKSDNEWVLCFENNEPPAIPQISFLGFSAETGELSDNHDIIAISAKNLYTAQPSRQTSGSGRGQKTRPNGQGSWTWFLFKIFLFFALVGGGYVSYTAWRANKKRSHRF